MAKSRKKNLTAKQTRRAIYIDFEKRAIEDEPPAMLGVLFDPGLPSGGHWPFYQYVFDARLQPLAEALGHPFVSADLNDVLDALVEKSDREQRHLVSWSLHDDELIKQWSSHTAYRYRNAIRVAKRLKRRRSADDETYGFQHNALQDHLAAAGYIVPEEAREGAGGWLANVRERA